MISMDPDRFQQNSKLFILGLVSLLVCLSLLTFGLYILPFLLWKWNYDVPALVLQLREWFKDSYDFSEIGASWMVFLIFIIPALICGYISQWSSNYIEKKMYHLDNPDPEKTKEIQKDLKESMSLGLKITLLIILVIIAVTIVQWLLAPPTSYY